MHNCVHRSQIKGCPCVAYLDTTGNPAPFILVFDGLNYYEIVKRYADSVHQWYRVRTRFAVHLTFKNLFRLLLDFPDLANDLLVSRKYNLDYSLRYTSASDHLSIFRNTIPLDIEITPLNCSLCQEKTDAVKKVDV